VLSLGTSSIQQQSTLGLPIISWQENNLKNEREKRGRRKRDRDSKEFPLYMCH